VVQTGLDVQEQERQRFALADQLARSTDAGEQRRLKEERSHLTFDGGMDVVSSISSSAIGSSP
jgi:hypothetical protein